MTFHGYESSYCKGVIKNSSRAELEVERENGKSTAKRKVKVDGRASSSLAASAKLYRDILSRNCATAGHKKERHSGGELHHAFIQQVDCFQSIG